MDFRLFPFNTQKIIFCFYVKAWYLLENDHNIRGCGRKLNFLVKDFIYDIKCYKVLKICFSCELVYIVGSKKYAYLIKICYG